MKLLKAVEELVIEDMFAGLLILSCVGLAVVIWLFATIVFIWPVILPFFPAAWIIKTKMDSMKE